MISVRAVSKFFSNKPAVDKVSFSLKEGQTLVLLGTSGSGKTTTLRMINRLLNPSQGEIFINDRNITKQNPQELRRGMGYVLQNYGLFPHYSIAENIAIVPKLLKWEAGKIAARTDELLAKLQLPPAQYRSAYPHQLSGGQKQRVGLARALAADPPILLMDEPFGALDTLTRMAVRKDFKELDELKKKTIILVTHDVQEAFDLGNVIGLMDKGKLEQLGTPEDLLFRPANNFVKDFIRPQKLQLQLQSISLQAVWDWLPPAGTISNSDVDSSVNLWEVLENLAGNKKFLTVTDRATGVIKAVTSPDVFSILQQYKLSLRHE